MAKKSKKHRTAAVMTRQEALARLESIEAPATGEDLNRLVNAFFLIYGEFPQVCYYNASAVPRLRAIFGVDANEQMPAVFRVGAQRLVRLVPHQVFGLSVAHDDE